MEQDSPRGSRRSTPRPDGRPARPKHRLEDGSPPTAEVNPLPLPRRSAQAHIEPQLRGPRGSGTGTPFDAFAAADEGGGTADDSGRGDGGKGDSGKGDGRTGDGRTGDGAPKPADEPKAKMASTPAAAFKKGVRQGRRRRPPAG